MSDQPNEIRITSPDGDVDALYNHGLYIVPKGSFIPINGTPLIDNSPLFVGNNLRGLRLTWNGPHVLEVHFDAGDVSVFRSPWYPHMPLWYDELSDPNIWDKNREHIIEIRLVPSFPLAAPEWLKTKN